MRKGQLIKCEDDHDMKRWFKYLTDRGYHATIWDRVLKVIEITQVPEGEEHED